MMDQLGACMVFIIIIVALFACLFIASGLRARAGE
jgi:hypothetical protein